MIFIVEDDENIRQLEEYAIRNSGYEVKGMENGDELFAELKSVRPELILLDVMLPETDGISILKKLKGSGNTKDIPVIIVSAKSQELDAVIGLDSGADDYVAKPFGVVELISRIKAVLRRAGGTKEGARIKELGEIELDPDRHEVKVEGEICVLTYKEFRLLEYLMENRGRVLTREGIMTAVWGEDFLGESRTVDMHIKTLRKKLGKAGERIITVRNIGYKID